MSTELKSMKDQATKLGIKFPNNITAEKLSEKIRAHYAEQSEKGPATKQSIRDKAVLEAKKLVRVIVTPHEPRLSKDDSVLRTVGNAVIGKFSRAIPYGVPTHIEQIILDNLKQEIYRSTVQKKDGKGQITRKHVQKARFSIEELEPLTEKELKALAQAQLARKDVE